MIAAKYIVIGKYDCERNSWIPNGDIRHVCSAHRTESAAWAEAPRHHTRLGGCDGSDMLTKVMQRAARAGSRKAGNIPEQYDTYEHAGWIYIECDYFAAHSIGHDGFGLVSLVKN